MALDGKAVHGCLEPTFRSAPRLHHDAPEAPGCGCSFFHGVCPRHRGRGARGRAGALVQWLLPVAALLYLLIVVPTALLCGFWQAVIVSLSAVVAQSYFTARQPRAIPQPTPPTPSRFWSSCWSPLLISRLSARVTDHAREAESRGGQMHDLYEFTRRTLQMNLHVEPGPQLAELVHEIFALEAVAVFDADLHEVYQAGYWNVDPQEMAQNVYYFETSDDDPETGIGRRVVRLGTVPVGSLVVRGETSPLTNNAIASLIAITFDRYRAFANESRIETERRTEQLRATVLDSLAHAYKTPLTAIRAASTGLGEMGQLSAGQAELVALIDEQTGLLGDLTTRLLTTARLDAGEVAIHAAQVSVGAAHRRGAGQPERPAGQHEGRHRMLEDENLVLCCDRQLMVMLLTQYIDNACKYSIFGTTITIRVLHLQGESHFFRAQLRAGDPHGGPRAHLRPLLSFVDVRQPRLRHRNRALCGQAGGADSWRLCVGDQRRAGRHHVLCRHSVPGERGNPE